LKFASFLRATKEFTEAGVAWDTYKHGIVADPEAKNDDPPETLLRAARARMDVVASLIDRRELAGAINADMIEAICLYSDASPVTGTELQGMVAEVVFKSGNLRRIVLPGASLSYGSYDAVNKTIALLHALWLTFGIDKATLRKALELVVSITTDFGVEMLTVEVPDCVDAFYSWMEGEPISTCGLYINWERRLFPRCFRVSGWSHACGNVMKSVAKAVPGWPEILHALRDLCNFLAQQNLEKAHFEGPERAL